MLCVCVCACVGVYIRVGWNPCPGHPTKVSNEGPTPSSIKFSQVTDLTDDDSPLRLPTSKSALFIHVGWNPCPGITKCEGKLMYMQGYNGSDSVAKVP